MNNQKGLTLVEVLATVTIATFVIGIIFTAILFANKHYNRLTDQEMLQREALHISNHMINEIRRTSFVVSSDSNYVLKLDAPSASTNEDYEYTYYAFDEPTGTVRVNMNKLTNPGSIPAQYDLVTMELSTYVKQLDISIGSLDSIHLRILLETANEVEYTYETTILLPQL